MSALALQSKSDTPTIISLAGNMVLYEICNLIGAMTIAPYKFMWWVAGLIFLGLVFMVLMQRLNNPEGYGGPNLQVRLRLPRVQATCSGTNVGIFASITISTEICHLQFLLDIPSAGCRLVTIFTPWRPLHVSAAIPVLACDLTRLMIFVCSSGRA